MPIEDEDLPTEVNTPEEARRALNGILAYIRANPGDEHSRNRALINDNQAALRLLQEERRQPAAPAYEGDRAFQTRYVAPDAEARGPREGAFAGNVRMAGYNDARSGVYVPGLLDDVDATSPEHAELQRAFDNRRIYRMIKGASHQGQRVVQSPHFDAEVQRAADAFGPEVRAWVDTNGTGGEFLPTDTLPSWEREIQLQRAHRVPGLFGSVQIPRDIAIPTMSGAPIPYQVSGAVDDDPAQIPASSIGTGSQSIVLATLGARVVVDRNAAEEALIAVMDSLIRPAVAGSMVAGEEDCVINGDTTASHRDTGLASWNPDNYYKAAPGGGTNDHRRTWMGLRHRATDATNSTDRSTFSFTTFMTDRASLAGGQQGQQDIIAIGNATGLVVNHGTLDEVVTVDKYGPGAVVLSGEVSRLGGVPLIESQFMTGDLNASGVFDNVTKTKTGYLTLKRSRFMWFRRRGITLEVVWDATRQVWHLVATMRGTFGSFDSSTTKNVHFAYNQ